MNTPLEPMGFTPYKIIGQLVQLKAKNIPSQDYKIQAIDTWNRTEFKKREDRLDVLAKLVTEIGQPNLHPWRGCNLKAVLPQDVERFIAKISNLSESLSKLKVSIIKLSAMCEVLSCTFEQTDDLLRFAHVLSEAPMIDAVNLKNTVWKNRRTDIPLLVAAVKCYLEKKESLDGKLIQDAWEDDLCDIRRVLKSYENSTFRILFREYRKAKTALRGYSVEGLPAQISEQASLLDELAEGKLAFSRVREWDALGQNAFGNYWNGLASDWKVLNLIEEWEYKAAKAALCSDIHKVAATVLANKTSLEELIFQIESVKDSIFSEIEILFNEMELDIKIAFEFSNIRAIPFNDLLVRFRAWFFGPELVQPMDHLFGAI